MINLLSKSLRFSFCSAYPSITPLALRVTQDVGNGGLLINQLQKELIQWIKTHQTPSHQQKASQPELIDKINKINQQLLSNDFFTTLHAFSHYDILTFTQKQLRLLYSPFSSNLHRLAAYQLNQSLLFFVKADPLITDSIIYLQFMKFYVRSPLQVFKTKYALKNVNITLSETISRIFNRMIIHSFLPRNPPYCRQLYLPMADTSLCYLLQRHEGITSPLALKLLFDIFIQIKTTYRERLKQNLYHQIHGRQLLVRLGPIVADICQAVERNHLLTYNQFIKSEISLSSEQQTLIELFISLFLAQQQLLNRKLVQNDWNYVTITNQYEPIPHNTNQQNQYAKVSPSQLLPLPLIGCITVRHFIERYYQRTPKILDFISKVNSIVQRSWKIKSFLSVASEKQKQNFLFNPFPLQQLSITQLLLLKQQQLQNDSISAILLKKFNPMTFKSLWRQFISQAFCSKSQKYKKLTNNTKNMFKKYISSNQAIFMLLAPKQLNQLLETIEQSDHYDFIRPIFANVLQRDFENMQQVILDLYKLYGFMEKWGHLSGIGQESFNNGTQEQSLAKQQINPNKSQLSNQTTKLLVTPLNLQPLRLFLLRYLSDNHQKLPFTTVQAICHLILKHQTLWISFDDQDNNYGKNIFQELEVWGKKIDGWEQMMRSQRNHITKEINGL